MIPSVTETFRDGTVLVTGFTGFLGKLLVEKLLRSCSVKNVAVIVRNKNDITAEQRILQIFDKSTIYLDNAQHCCPVKNIAVIVRNKNDITAAQRISQIFDESGIVHLSTAYSHCLRNEVKEQYYPVPITVKELKMKLKTIDESTPYIKGDWLNTYTFTKAITENVIKENENNLPISIARISMVTCTKYEPCPGWMDGLNGPPIVVVPLIMGFFRTAPVDLDKLSSLIPADYTINAIISVMWHTVNIQNSNQVIEEPKIFNIVADSARPLKWTIMVTGELVCADTISGIISYSRENFFKIEINKNQT